MHDPVECDHGNETESLKHSVETHMEQAQLMEVGVDGLVTEYQGVPLQAAQKRDGAGVALDEDRCGQLDKLLDAAGMYTAFLAEQLARMAGGNTAEERPRAGAAPAAVVGSKRKLPQTQTQALPGWGEDVKVPACLPQASRAACTLSLAVV